MPGVLLMLRRIQTQKDKKRARPLQNTVGMKTRSSEAVENLLQRGALHFPRRGAEAEPMNLYIF